jgi:PAS domain-containing protein
VTTQIDGDRYLHHATDVTSLVRAETARKELLQTLAKTFANLTTGLAVFDSNRQLALFNPALVDLTGLPAELLSGQPSLMEFFDRLRDRRVMPEPKDYGDWRKQIENMTDTAAGGLYVETWTLATGLTYRVTGRPHPDNAVAFLFEDISDEVSLRRRFRAQLDLRQAALDGMPAAVAVIGRDRVVTLCNAACRRMLGVDPESSFADMTATDLMTVCNRVFPNPSAWREIEARIKGARPSAPLKRRVTDDKGQKIGCRLAPLPDGALMLTLDRAETPVPENAALGA